MDALPHYVRLARVLSLGAALAPSATACQREAMAQQVVVPPGTAAPPCPAQQPANGTSCARSAQRCVYGGMDLGQSAEIDCVCVGVAGNLAWQCRHPPAPHQGNRGPLPPPEMPA